MSSKDVDLDRVVHGTLLGDAVNGASVPALLANEDGQYLAANDAACDLTGFSRAELVALRVGALAADDRSGQLYANISHGRKMRGRKRIRRRTGEIVDCRYWAIRTRVVGLPYFLVLLWQK